MYSPFYMYMHVLYGLTFMHAASAACTVLITACIRFCAFFTNIMSAYKVAICYKTVLPSLIIGLAIDNSMWSTYRDIIWCGDLDGCQHGQLCAESRNHLCTALEVAPGPLILAPLADQVCYLGYILAVHCHCLRSVDHVHLVLKVSLSSGKLCHLSHLLGHLFPHRNHGVLFHELICELS